MNEETTAIKKYFDNPVFVCEWEGFKVYAEDFGEIAPAIGLPRFVLYKEGKARLTTEKEAFAIIENLPDKD